MQIQQIIEHLRLTGTEGTNLEVKSGIGKSTLETLSAFANTAGGTIIFGLSEDAAFAPVAGFNPKEILDKIQTSCNRLDPILRPRVQTLPLPGGHAVVVAEIDALPPDARPCFIRERGRNGGSFIRSGESDRKLTPYEIDRLLEARIQPKYDEKVVDDASADDLDEQLVGAYLDVQKKRLPRTFAKGEDMAMKRLRLLKDGHPTLASLIALGGYPQEFFPRLTLSFAHFPGTSKGDIAAGKRLLDSKTLAGPIPDLVEEGIRLVEQNMGTAAMIDGAYRRDVPDYPIVAIREALVNALMHRDYSPQAQGAQVQISLFVDRLEIQSPGGLYGPVRLGELGHDGVSSTRNMRIAEILENLHIRGGALAENRGTGIQAIRQSLAENLMPEPLLEADLNSFKITFFRRRIAVGESRLTAAEQILEILSKTASMSAMELTKATNFSRSAIQAALKGLVADNRVEQLFPPRSPKQRYRLKERT